MTRLKFLLLSLAAFAITSTSSSCFIVPGDDEDIFGCVRGSGGTVHETLNIADFQSVALKIHADVYITQGNTFHVEVDGQPNIIDRLERDVHNGNWEIEFDDCVYSHVKLKVYITMPVIESLVNTSSGNIFGENEFQIDDLNLTSTGSGDIDLAVDADDLDVTITGSGDIILEGSCDDIDLTITGSGDYLGFNLETQSANVTLSGSGDAEIRVVNLLDVRITGSGDVLYKGNPTVNSTITGSGRVKNAN